MKWPDVQRLLRAQRAAAAPRWAELFGRSPDICVLATFWPMAIAAHLAKTGHWIYAGAIAAVWLLICSYILGILHMYGIVRVWISLPLTVAVLAILVMIFGVPY
jgi:hypothetical protein